MDGGVWQTLWQRRQTTYENTVLHATSALFGFFCLRNGLRGNTEAAHVNDLLCESVAGGTKWGLL